MGQSVNQSGVLPSGGGVVTTSSSDGGTGDTPSSLATGGSRRDDSGMAGADTATTAAEAADKRQKARQRWKILCLVKASDTVADETARKERVQEKVDDWMRTMVRITKLVSNQ